MKGSADALVLFSINGQKELYGVEVKARVTKKTVDKEKLVQAKARKLSLIERNQEEALKRIGRRSNDRYGSKKRYHSLEWDDEELRHFVSDRKELGQILHLAMLYEMKAWILVMGDESGKVIVCIVVHFSHTILDAWWSLVDFGITEAVKPLPGI